MRMTPIILILYCNREHVNPDMCNVVNGIITIPLLLTSQELGPKYEKLRNLKSNDPEFFYRCQNQTAAALVLKLNTNGVCSQNKNLCMENFRNIVDWILSSTMFSGVKPGFFVQSITKIELTYLGRIQYMQVQETSLISTPWFNHFDGK